MGRLDRTMELLAARWMENHKLWPSYTTDLGMEALLAYHDATGKKACLDFVERVWHFRHPPSASLSVGNCYFTCLHFETYLRTGNEEYTRGLVELAENWMTGGPRNPQGALGHRGVPRGAVFADLLGGLAPLLARAGQLSGREEFFAESIRQIRIYRQTLRDPRSGLWHHAYGWHGACGVSPVGWCRGNGWVLRGLEKSLQALPDDQPGKQEVAGIFHELLAALLPWQGTDGTWRQLVHRPDSYPEASGSALIIWALGSPVLQDPQIGGVPDDPDSPLMQGVSGLLQMIDGSGTVREGCPACPPLPAEDDYLAVAPICGDPHAQAAALLALARVCQRLEA